MKVADLFASLGLQVDKQSWSAGDKLISGARTALGALVAYEGAKKVGELIMSTIDLGGHLDDLRQKTGLSAVALQEYGFAAKLGGSDMDGFAASVGKFARVIKEAKGGSAEAAQAIASAGLSAKDLQGALTGGSAGLDNALGTIADKFESMPNGPKKTALAMALFGKSGAELIPTLNLGRKGLADLRQEAEDLGVVMSEDGVTAADALGDNIDKLKMSVTGLKNQAIAALLPTLKDLVDSSLAWIKANKADVVNALKVAVQALVVVFKALAAVVGVMVDVFEFFQEHTDIATAVIVALGTIIAAFAIDAAVSWLLAFWPLVLVAAVIAGIVLVVRDLWKSITTGKGKAADAFRWLKRVAKDWWESLKQIGSDIAEFFTSIGTGIKTAFSEAFDWVIAKAKAFSDTLRNIPGLKQLGDILGQTAGFAVTHLQGDQAADGAYENAKAGGQFSGTEEEFNAQRGHVVSAPDRGAAASSTAATGASPITTINVDMTVNPSAGMDEESLGAHVADAFHKQMAATLRDAHAATGGADQP